MAIYFQNERLLNKIYNFTHLSFIMSCQRSKCRMPKLNANIYSSAKKMPPSGFLK